MNNLSWKYVKPLTNKDSIGNFEQTYGYSLPNDLKFVVEQFNNGRPNLDTFDTTTEKECQFKKLLSFNPEDTENIYDFLDIETNIKNLIPIANTPSGNLICLHDNQIVYWRHETDDIEFLASSIADFLAKLY
ncbi:SMI1/KNR4 family protein [Moraxella sp. Tifton1]|uniref:SMI1/KNR4 family protein n=1 Tax=Moraxella oculi TaxID=2940516 RepID=UPI00201176B2|nr:SMI1/KNR4 family protein [Moraxella sp. Tifton1]MCL1623430.1 SMI1/KNR4 family protein [Moraxella sp. Tifton1]